VRAIGKSGFLSTGTQEVCAAPCARERGVGKINTFGMVAIARFKNPTSSHHIVTDEEHAPCTRPETPAGAVAFQAARFLLWCVAA